MVKQLYAPVLPAYSCFCCYNAARANDCAQRPKNVVQADTTAARCWLIFITAAACQVARCSPRHLRQYGAMQYTGGQRVAMLYCRQLLVLPGLYPQPAFLRRLLYMHVEEGRPAAGW